MKIPVSSFITAVFFPWLFTSAALAAAPSDVILRDFYASTQTAHLALEKFIPSGATLFFGDSMVQHMSLTCMGKKAANFGITGDTSAGVLHRMPNYNSLKSAAIVVLESGINDIGFGSKFDDEIVSNYGKMLQLTPIKSKVYILGIFPVDEKADKQLVGYNARIKKINAEVSSLCVRDGRCTYLDMNQQLQLAANDGNLKPELHRAGEGVHLNETVTASVERILAKTIGVSTRCGR